MNDEAFGEDYDPRRSFWVRWFESWKNRRYLGNLRRAGATGGRLLEVGVGTGSFLRAARDAGFEAEGCDLSAPLCRRVQQVSGVPVHNVPLEDLPLASYDVLAMHHVLEHVSNPVEFLRAAAARLRPGGTMHIAVPNIDCWEARFRSWNLYLPVHLAYFSPGTLAAAVSAAGLRLERRSTVDTFGAWFLVLFRFALRRHRNPSVEMSSSIGRTRGWARYVEHPYRLAMLATGAVTAPLRWLQGRLGKGDELMVVARRVA